ncbi:MAG: hypothetical protein EPO00_00880 [Chloroflexota bacterium]|nr:MAG: hypothetical protein EPO00_00880 [Chloroflexota bacterium]
MAAVVSYVTGTVAADRQASLVEQFRAGVAAGLPPAIASTMLVRDGDDVGILSVWRDADDLRAMIATAEEPFARRVIREAGGTPSVRIFEVLVAGEHHPG